MIQYDYNYSTSGCIPRYSILKKQGYRVVIVEKHLIFYKINEEEKTVILYAFMDGRMEHLNLFCQMGYENDVRIQKTFKHLLEIQH